MKKFKKIFPSRNYITIDAFGDVEIIFNPTGDGFDGEDKLIFRRGRWAFRVNDFLAGKVLPNGEKEGMNRKVYSLGIVYEEADGEPIITTTYVDPTSVIPLDGSVVQISNGDDLKADVYTSEIHAKIGSFEPFNSGDPYGMGADFWEVGKRYQVLSWQETPSEYVYGWLDMLCVEILPDQTSRYSAKIIDSELYDANGKIEKKAVIAFGDRGNPPSIQFSDGSVKACAGEVLLWSKY